MAFDLGSDCGIYNVTTLERARRQGLGTALTAVHVHNALARGCQTASLQSTEMAERVYTAVGFRDLGRILEYVRRRSRRVRQGTSSSGVREFGGLSAPKAVARTLRDAG
jgi:ribosomal protein S18 acetylase RimI-like enzyme